MNLQEYKRRIENAHTVTGIPSYWTELQYAMQKLQEKDAEVKKWMEVARLMYAHYHSDNGAELIAVYEQAVGETGADSIV